MIRDGAFGWWLSGTPMSGSTPGWMFTEATPMCMYVPADTVAFTYDPAAAADWKLRHKIDERSTRVPSPCASPSP